MTQFNVSSKPPYKCAVIFCDNSGVDIILGVFPFVRQLLSLGTNVSLWIIDGFDCPPFSVLSEINKILSKINEIC